MAEIIEIAEGVYSIETPLEVMQFQPTAFVIANAETLIEPGPAICIPPLYQALEQRGIKNLRYIIPTHIHMDHAGGTGTLSRLYPEAQVLVHPRGLKHAVDPSRLSDSVKMAWGDKYEDDFGPISAVPESQIKTVEDGEIINAGDRELQFLYTPGHAPHHIAVFDHKLKALFCGEALGMPGYQLPAAAPMSFDLDSYLATIDKLQHIGLDMRMLIYSHGGVERAPAGCMARAAENARAFAEFVLNAMEQGKGCSETGKALGSYVQDKYDSNAKSDLQGYETIATGYITFFERKRIT
jgi:glyoxylase-like metal-dependent hydrolase (beta-lactamase superfamily II)